MKQERTIQEFLSGQYVIHFSNHHYLLKPLLDCLNTLDIRWQSNHPANEYIPRKDTPFNCLQLNAKGELCIGSLAEAKRLEQNICSIKNVSFIIPDHTDFLELI